MGQPTPRSGTVLMADRQDWIDWDNSMKSHIDQIEIKWKNDAVLAIEKQQEINRAIHSFNDTVIVAIEEIYKEQRLNRRMIALCGVLFTLNIVLGFVAFMEVTR